MKGGREKERKEERDPSTEKIYLIFNNVCAVFRMALDTHLGF